MCARGPSRLRSCTHVLSAVSRVKWPQPDFPKGGPWRAWVEPERAVREKEVLALFFRKGNRPEERFKNPAEVT